jgi:hypothetical protein
MEPVAKTAADALLQKSGIMQIGGVEYCVAPPTIATLARISAIVAELPAQGLDDNNVLAESLRIAKDVSKPISLVMATLIVGEKRPGLRSLKDEIRLRRIAKQIYHRASPEEIKDLFTRLLQHQEIGSFFGLTAFLLGVGMTKPTRKAEMTASGPQSQV